MFGIFIEQLVLFFIQYIISLRNILFDQLFHLIREL